MHRTLTWQWSSKPGAQRMQGQQRSTQYVPRSKTGNRDIGYERAYPVGDIRPVLFGDQVVLMIMVSEVEIVEVH